MATLRIRTGKLNRQDFVFIKTNDTINETSQAKLTNRINSNVNLRIKFLKSIEEDFAGVLGKIFTLSQVEKQQFDRLDNETKELFGYLVHYYSIAGLENHELKLQFKNETGLPKPMGSLECEVNASCCPKTVGGSCKLVIRF